MIERVQPNAPASIEAILRIYRAAIDPAERKSEEQIARMLASDRFWFFVHRESRDTVIDGFAEYFVPENDDFMLLEYLAVDESAQGKGIGGALVTETRAMLEQAIGRRAVLIEVDAAIDESDPNNAAVRRQQFYRRLGARRIDGLRYILPIGTDPPAMDLWITGWDSETIAREPVKRWVRIIYEHVYECADDDPRIDSMFAGTGEQLKLIK